MNPRFIYMFCFTSMRASLRLVNIVLKYFLNQSHLQTASGFLEPVDVTMALQPAYSLLYLALNFAADVTHFLPISGPTEVCVLQIFSL